MRNTSEPEDQPDEIRVLIIEDEVLIGDLLATIVGNEEDMSVLGRAVTVATGVEAASRLKPDVILMDYQLPDGDGAECTRQIRAENESALVIMLTGRDRGQIVASAIEAGCSGFFTKTDRLEEIIDAIRTVHGGGSAFSQQVLTQVVDHLRRPHTSIAETLSERELQVLRLLARGCTTANIADTLFLSQHTVRNHVRNLIMKLRAHSKLEAVVFGVREGVIDLKDFASRE